MEANVLAAMDFHPPYHCDDSGVGNFLQNPNPAKPGPAQRLLKSSNSFIIWIEGTGDLLLLLRMYRDCVLTRPSCQLHQSTPQPSSPPFETISITSRFVRRPNPYLTDNLRKIPCSPPGCNIPPFRSRVPGSGKVDSLCRDIRPGTITAIEEPLELRKIIVEGKVLGDSFILVGWTREDSRKASAR